MAANPIPIDQGEVNDGSLCQVEDWGEDDPIETGDFTPEQKEELKQAVQGVAKHYMAVDKYVRRSEIMDARRQRFYRRGDQYIYWNTSQMLFLPWQGGGTGADPSDAQDTPRYTDVYNIYWPYLRALIAVGVQNPPGVNFEPDDPAKAVDITAARAAEKYRHFIDRVNKRKELQSDVMSLFGTDGRTGIYTRSVRDKIKFGVNDEGEPHQAEVMGAFGVLESKPVPLLEAKQENWVAFFLSDEIEINLAKQTYPQYAKRIKQGTSAIGESAYERMARIGVLQGTKLLQQAGDAYAHLATRHRAWLRPAAFREAPDALQDTLWKLFPEGCKVIFCGDAYCGSYNISMDDQITVKWPGPGDGASKPSMLKDLVPVQDAFNDYKNLEKEIFDFTIPVTYRDSELGDIEALREQFSEPGNSVAVTRPGGVQNLAACFYSEPPANAPESLVNAYQDLRGTLSQFMTGAQPALFGGSDKDNDTASGIAMLRDQAMGQFSIAWGHLQELFATSYKQAVMCAAKYRAAEETVNVAIPEMGNKAIVSEIAIADLQKGNFHAYPDTDSSFPETTGSKRQTLTALVTQALTNPLAAEAYGVLEPDNLEIQREVLGITDWVIPAANARDKQMGEIERLLQQKPTLDPLKAQEFLADKAIEDEAAQNLAGTGLPLEESQPDPQQLMKSTIPVDVDWDFHEFEYKTVKDWLSSPEGLEEARSNPWGVLNVKLHGKEHQMAMAAQTAPLLPPPAAAAPPIPPKPAAPQAEHGAIQ